jgi:hypothetical protein
VPRTFGVREESLAYQDMRAHSGENLPWEVLWERAEKYAMGESDDRPPWKKLADRLGGDDDDGDMKYPSHLPRRKDEDQSEDESGGGHPISPYDASDDDDGPDDDYRKRFDRNFEKCARKYGLLGRPIRLPPEVDPERRRRRERERADRL